MSKDIFIARKAGALFVLRSVVYKVVYKKSYDNSGATPQGWVCALEIYSYRYYFNNNLYAGVDVLSNQYGD